MRITGFVLIASTLLLGCVGHFTSARIARVEELDEAPRVLAQPMVKPKEVWQLSRITSEAVVELTVQEDGSVSDVVLVVATKPDVGVAAVASVKLWRFTPPKKGGRPAQVRLKIPIVFGIGDIDFIPLEKHSTRIEVRSILRTEKSAQQGARANDHSRHASCYLISFRMKLPTGNSNLARVAPAVVVAHL